MENILANWPEILKIAGVVFAIMTLIVKTFPTIPAKFPALVWIMKLLGNITNRQTDDEAKRAAVK